MRNRGVRSDRRRVRVVTGFARTWSQCIPTTTPPDAAWLGFHGSGHSVTSARPGHFRTSSVVVINTSGGAAKVYPLRFPVSVHSLFLRYTGSSAGAAHTYQASTLSKGTPTCITTASDSKDRLSTSDHPGFAPTITFTVVHTSPPGFRPPPLSPSVPNNAPALRHRLSFPPRSPNRPCSHRRASPST